MTSVNNLARKSVVPCHSSTHLPGPTPRHSSVGKRRSHAGKRGRNFRPIERFTCVLYERSSKCVEVNALRKDLFPRKVQHMTGLPPTQAALLEHVNRSLFQSSIWLQSFQARQNVPSADAFGWRKRDTLWELVWTPLAKAATG